MPNNAQKRRKMLRKSDWCYICGLRIPPEIVDSSHPLFGTTDHIVPKANGGKDSARNRVPAHRACNQKKSSMVKLPAKMVTNLQTKILRYLEKFPPKTPVTTKQELREASARIGFMPMYPHQIPNQQGIHLNPTHQWDTDGGALHPSEHLRVEFAWETMNAR